MISSIEWVPAGVADPNPKKYEFSAAELEMIKMMEEQNLDGEVAEIEKDPVPPKTDKKSSSKLPKIENTLPADLRMDEYSSDEDENDAVQGATIGNLLVEDDEDSENEDFIEDEEEENHQMKTDDDMNSYDSDDSDDLDDVPDTREYTPIDVEGLTSLGLSHVGTNAPTYMDMPDDDDDDDDDSDAEDVQIQDGDAIIISAKTEDVSFFIEVLCIDFGAYRSQPTWIESCRILHRWRSMYTSKRRGICLCTTIFHFLRFHCAWLMEIFRHRDPLVTSAR